MIFDLTRRGIEIPAGALSALEFTKLRKRLTVTSMGFGDRRLTMQCYFTDTKARMLYAARMEGIVQLDKMGHSVRNCLPYGEPLSADTSQTTLKLKDYQEPIFQFLVNKVYSETSTKLGLSSCYLNLQPGKGKTFIIMALIQHFKCKTLITVPGKELVTQTVTTLRATFPQLRIGEYWSKTKSDGDIVVMTTRSACLDEYSFKEGKKTVTLTAAEYFARFGFTAMDEVHTYCTKEQSAIFQRAGSLRTFACSGTSNEREDKMDAVAYMHVGKPIMGAKLMESVIADQENPTTPWKFEAVCLRYNGPREFTETLTSVQNTVSCPKMVSQFSKDPYRSQLLVDTVRKLVTENHQVFVMLDRTELAKLAWDYLSTAFDETELALSPGIKYAGIITGKTKDRDRAAARQSRVIVGSYSCIGTGLSFDEFSAAVFWHPRRNKFRQFLNRIFRENGDRSVTRKAYYLQDNSTSIKSQYYGFKKICEEERGITPTVVVHDYADITVTPAVQKIADDFVQWDAEQQLKNSGNQNDNDDNDDNDIIEDTPDGLD